ncbi:hypothetical protein ACJJI5_14685 [Microbulbifer sp. EKSA008]|uniref:hypothetical protein n=1 Tax=unclassified Microbulbifer TaxID=2619833 RepID=UPI00403A7B95
MAVPDQVTLIANSTYTDFINAPILSSGDDTYLGYYITIAGSNSAWSDATTPASGQ